jgi:hypothetical protein
MTNLKTIAAAALVAAGFGAAPAQAVITTFAQYGTIGTGANVYFKNNGAGTTQGTGGSFYSIATPTSTVAGARNVSFSFLQALIAPSVTNQVAQFSLFGTVTNTPALLTNGFLIQENINGVFSFTSTTAITVGATTYAAGSNLLSGTFTGANIFGQRLGSSGSFTSNIASVNYTSDFLTFDNTVDRDFSLSLSSILSPLQAAPTGGTPTRALRTFKAVSTGSFSSDPAPIVNGVPEPEMWALMVAGFGLVGVQLRRRSKAVTSITV